MGRWLSPAHHKVPMLSRGPLSPAHPGVEEGEAGIPLQLHPPHLGREEVEIPLHRRPPHLRGKETGMPFRLPPRSLGGERREYPSTCAPRPMGGERREYPSVSTLVVRPWPFTPRGYLLSTSFPRFTRFQTSLSTRHAS